MFVEDRHLQTATLVLAAVSAHTVVHVHQVVGLSEVNHPPFSLGVGAAVPGVTFPFLDLAPGDRGTSIAPGATVARRSFGVLEVGHVLAVGGEGREPREGHPVVIDRIGQLDVPSALQTSLLHVLGSELVNVELLVLLAGRDAGNLEKLPLSVVELDAVASTLTRTAVNPWAVLDVIQLELFAEVDLPPVLLAGTAGVPRVSGAFALQSGLADGGVDLAPGSTVAVLSAGFLVESHVLTFVSVRAEPRKRHPLVAVAHNFDVTDAFPSLDDFWFRSWLKDCVSFTSARFSGMFQSFCVTSIELRLVFLLKSV
mmetsp:Transcript_21335/g.42347  ORF Transcript_21335/g.42347 Transcript_21335/m.42347 type:complete len:312 (-) Transcript_21335:639-1574(-)